jgi:hypothetical protein
MLVDNNVYSIRSKSAGRLCIYLTLVIYSATAIRPDRAGNRFYR